MTNETNQISKQIIEQHLKGCPFSTNIIVLDTVDSTNTYAKELAKTGATGGTCVIAKTQTNGRGRLGRSFFSPSDTGIYMSILFRPENEYRKDVPHTIAACVAVCKALEKFSDNPLAIKWVNDIFVNGKKVCGILTEGGSTAGSGEIDYYIIGIGINIAAPDGGFPEDIQNIAGAISDTKAQKNQIIASIISEFFSLCQKSTIENIIDEYKKRCFILGRSVSYTKDGEPKVGIAENINSSGNLVVRLDNGKTDTLISGEISLKSENYTS